jgi:hypothetical protein
MGICNTYRKDNVPVDTLLKKPGIIEGIPDWNLFVLECIGRIHNRGPVGMGSGDHQGDDQCQKC